MVEQSVVNRQAIGSNPIDIAKWQGGWMVKASVCNTDFYEFDSHPCLEIGSIEQLVGSPDCKSGLFGACRFESYYFHNKHL